MVRKRKRNSIPDRSPGSTRTVSSVRLPGHLPKNGLQDSGSSVEQPGLETVELLEGKTQRRKFAVAENREIVYCYFMSNPSKRGFQKRMYQIWKQKHPDTEISDLRLADQLRFIMRRKVFTDVELDELQRNIQGENIEWVMLEDTQNIQKENRVSESEGIMANEQELDENIDEEEEQFLSNSTSSQKLTGKQQELKQKIVQHMREVKERKRLPALRIVSKKELSKEIQDLIRVVAEIKTVTLQETNQLMYSAAAVATQDLGFEVNKEKKMKVEKPKWKVRLENKINKLRKDASQLTDMKGKKLKNQKTRKYLIKKYKLDTRMIKEALEIVKQQIVAVAKKVSRYEARVMQYQQNLLFSSNQKRFYQSINGGKWHNTEQPAKEEVVKFWENIWDNPVGYNKNAVWIKEVEEKLVGNNMENFLINADLVEKRAKKIKNWTAPGKDELHGFWLKHLTSLHERLAQQLNKTLEGGEIDGWMTTGKTYLLVKDCEKGAVPNNYRPITCLPTTFKLLTAILADAIQDHLETNNLLPAEQKGNCRGSRGTKDQLLIDKMILENCKKRKTNLNVAWIDYRKAFDSLPHSWILKCLDMMGINNNIKNFVKRAMQVWKTCLLVNGEEIGDVNIRRGIFQGDSLSPLLFVISIIPLSIILNKANHGYQTSRSSAKFSHLLYMDDLKLYGKLPSEIESLLNTVRIYSRDISMEFGLEKCASLEIIKGKVTTTEGIEMPNGNIIKNLTPEDGYKYLGILQSNRIENAKVKNNVSKEYVRRVRKVLKSRLNGGNIIRAINAWAIPVVRYTAGIVEWTQAELDALDRKTRKVMTINHALHPRSDVDRLYLPRKEGGRGLLQVKQTVEEEERGLAEYINTSREEMLEEVRKAGLLRIKPAKEEYKREQVAKRRENWHNKPMHGQYFRNIQGKVDNNKTWQWLRNGTLKKETESLIFSAQEQSLRTNAVRAKIDKTQKDSRCRLCKEAEETIEHLICCCKKISQTDYLDRHNKVATMIHWNICKNYNLPATKNWWNHVPGKIVENEEAKILWDFRIQTDRHLEHNTPDLTIITKEQVWIIDVAVPGDSRVNEKQLEKLTKYKDLQIEVERLWEKKTRIVPIVVGALGAIPKDLQHHLGSLGINKISTHQLQKAALLGTARILRRYL